MRSTIDRHRRDDRCAPGGCAVTIRRVAPVRERADVPLERARPGGDGRAEQASGGGVDAAARTTAPSRRPTPEGERDRDVAPASSAAGVTPPGAARPVSRSRRGGLAGGRERGRRTASGATALGRPRPGSRLRLAGRGGRRSRRRHGQRDRAAATLAPTAGGRRACPTPGSTRRRRRSSSVNGPAGARGRVPRPVDVGAGPVRRATTAPVASVTVTVHGSATRAGRGSARGRRARRCTTGA